MPDRRRLSYELIAILMFSSMMALLLTGQRVFGAIGFVAVIAALPLVGRPAGLRPRFAQAIKLMKWYPLLTLPMFIFMGYMLSESRIADDLYRMFHVWMGGFPGGLAIGTIGLMVLISAMNGLSVAGMAIGATIALPELLKRNYDKRDGHRGDPGGSSLGILMPPSVVLVLYAMIARQPVGQLWLAGVLPGLMMAGLFILYIAIRCRLHPALGPPLSAGRARRHHLGREAQPAARGLLPFMHLLPDDGPLRQWLDQRWSKARPSARWRLSMAAVLKGRMTREVFENVGAQDARHHLHVHVDHPCGAGLRRRVRRAGRGQGDREPLHGEARSRALDHPDPDAAQLPADGHVSRRHRHAGDRGAALCAAGQDRWASIWSGTVCSTPSPARSPT
jgi:hypothetical protein